MISFRNDYSEGACERVIEKMVATNTIQHIGYGEDEVCEAARQAIKDRIGCQTCDIHFLVGGTQTNLTIIASALKPYEAVIAVDSGHINVHETGAIEATGHKVLVAAGMDGKLTPEAIRRVYKKHEDEHMVKPAMVYISNATEVGTIYHKEELVAIHEVCQALNLLLFMDGARLASAMTADDNDVTYQDLCRYCDVFYLGGTKNGALFGEAVVMINDALKPDFRYMIKQRGGMLAKGWLLGIQFLALFENDTYEVLGRHANEMAQCLQQALSALHIPFLIETTTNQIFPIFQQSLIQALHKNYDFQVWEELDDQHTAMRLVTSWATKKEDVLAFIQDITTLVNNV